MVEYSTRFQHLLGGCLHVHQPSEGTLFEYRVVPRFVLYIVLSDLHLTWTVTHYPKVDFQAPMVGDTVVEVLVDHSVGDEYIPGEYLV